VEGRQSIAGILISLAHFNGWSINRPLGAQTMGHTERIIAELATLSEREQVELLAYVEALKAKRSLKLTAAQKRERDALAAELAPFRVSLEGYKFDREEANAR
jgi:hypothetical protein